MFTPWSTLNEMRSEMNRLREESNRLLGRWGASDARSAAPYPALNLWEDEANLYLEAELPGMALSDLEIYVTGDNSLQLKGARQSADNQGGSWHRQERGYGQFSRLVELPYPVDNERVSAEFDHGVLTVNLPKRQQAKARRIEIKANY